MPPSNEYALVASEDIFFASRIASVLRRMGFRTDTSTTPDEALARAAAHPVLTIVNLAPGRLGGVDLVRRLKQSGARHVVGFISHTLIPQVRDDARAAGADTVCANSAITQRLPEIVERILRPNTEPSAEPIE